MNLASPPALPLPRVAWLAALALVVALDATSAPGGSSMPADATSPRPDPAVAAEPTSVVPNTSPVVAEVDLDIPLDRAFRIFATEDGWKLLGAAQARIDFRIGGKILTHYDPKGVLGDPGTIENTFIAYEPERMVAFRISKPPAGFPFPDAWRSTWSVVTFTPITDQRTHVRCAMMGYDEGDESQRMRAFFAQGNAWVMEQLRKSLDGDASARAAAGGADAGADGASDPLAPIELDADVGAIPLDVWKCWTTREGMQSFLADANIDLRVGGRFEILFDPDAPEGKRGSEGCAVLSYDAPSMLSFSWNAPPKFDHARARRTWVVLRIEPRGPHGTRVSLHHLGFAEQARENPEHVEEWRAVRAYFSNAWPRVLAALRERFNPDAAAAGQ